MPRVHVCKPMLSLVMDCGHWHRIPCLKDDCDLERQPVPDPCPRCESDEEDWELWRNEMLDAELLRDRRLRPC